ncbi:MAG: hypothetical protein HY681_05060 [Chloroflexi bacterium]|nr:hypothetical protein [Chloroflexota bacterium]
MTDKIKSAVELAMERASKLGTLSPGETLAFKWQPEGERLAGRYLKGGSDLAKGFRAIDRSAVPHVLRGCVGALLANVTLPSSEGARATNQRMLDGIRLLCKDRKAIDSSIGRIQYVLDQYVNFGLHQMEEAHEALKQQFMANVEQEIQRRGMKGTVAVDPDTNPTFQNQWRATLSRIVEPFEANLAEMKRQAQELVLAKSAFP